MLLRLGRTAQTNRAEVGGGVQRGLPGSAFGSVYQTVLNDRGEDMSL